MVAAAQESKRLGLCQKSMFVVPNHLVGQWASEYLRLYPSANILVTTKQDFETGNRKSSAAGLPQATMTQSLLGIRSLKNPDEHRTPEGAVGKAA